MCVEGVVLNSAFPQWGRCCCTGGIVLHLVCDCIWIILWGFLSKDNNNTNYDTTCVPTGSVLQIQVHHCWAGSSVQPVGQRGGLWRFQRGRGRRGPEIFLHAAKCQGMKWLLLPLLFEERVCDTLKLNELQTKCSLFLFFFFLQLDSYENSDFDTGFYSDDEGAPPPKRRSLLVALRCVFVCMCASTAQ